MEQQGHLEEELEDFLTAQLLQLQLQFLHLLYFLFLLREQQAEAVERHLLLLLERDLV